MSVTFPSKSASFVVVVCLTIAGCAGGRSAYQHANVGQRGPAATETQQYPTTGRYAASQRYPLNGLNSAPTRAAYARSDIRLTQYQSTLQPDHSSHGKGSGVFFTAGGEVDGVQKAIAAGSEKDSRPRYVANENIRPIDFSSALSMAAGQNPQVEFANARIREAMAQLQGARTLWLPSIRGGVSYNKHDGTLQASNGAVTDVNRTSLQSGLGVQAIGAGTPAVPGVAAQFHAADALFQPKIANMRTAARHDEARVTTNDVLLDTSLAYLELLRAAQQQRIAEETFDHAGKLADLTITFAQTGAGNQADADRARTELAVRKNEVARAEEAAAVASARLAEILHVDPTVTLLPEEAGLAPIELVSIDMPRNEMLATGLSHRPELAQSRHLVGEAVERLRRERFAPLVPSVLLGMSYGGFGGSAGSSSTTNFAERLDFDAVAFWEVRNLGFGESSARGEARARIDQARLREVQAMDRVAREIAEAHAQVTSRSRQISTAESGVQAALASYERNISRIREAQGLPLEVLQSIQALDQARREYLRALTDYNEAQFRLHRALGCPVSG